MATVERLTAELRPLMPGSYVESSAPEYEARRGLCDPIIDKCPAGIAGRSSVDRDLNRDKEMIGLAVSGATRCRYCAYFHAEAAGCSAPPKKKSPRPR